MIDMKEVAKVDTSLWKSQVKQSKQGRSSQGCLQPYKALQTLSHLACFFERLEPPAEIALRVGQAMKARFSKFT